MSAETAARIFESIGDLDVRDMLPELDLPVLVLHTRGDSMVEFEEGRRLASMIKGAKFIPLDSRNHLLMHHEPAWTRFVDEVRSFLGREVAKGGETETRSMKMCSRCNKIYGDEMLFCLDDGSPLNATSVGVDNGEETARRKTPTPR